MPIGYRDRDLPVTNATLYIAFANIGLNELFARVVKTYLLKKNSFFRKDYNLKNIIFSGFALSSFSVAADAI